MDTRLTWHATALSTLFADLENQARTADVTSGGTPGSVVVRKNAAGFRFYAHSFYGADGRKRETYVGGPVGSDGPERAATLLRERIAEVQELLPSIRLLAREGFHVVDKRTFAVLAALHTHGVWAAGGVLIGSHAYGVLLNRLGVRSAAYATEDIDVARARALALDTPPEGGLLGLLATTGLEFVPVPELDRDRPSSSFKLPGRSRFHVDLLAPSRDDSFPVVAVPELGAHATGLPFLGYLLEPSSLSAVLAREGCCAVRVPTPERFAVHKLLTSALRTGRSAKSERDVAQAAMIAAALAERHPGALEEARLALPRRALRDFGRGRDNARGRLEGRHPRAWKELGGR